MISVETMIIGIIGYGVVGKAADKTFTKHYETIKYDKFQDLSNFNDLKKCEFVFIMVPTPFNCVNNRVDDSAILESLSKLEEIEYTNIVVIKSTIPPGYTQRYNKNFNLKIAFNPEFLRESTTPNEDFENQEQVIIGTAENSIFESIKSMYEKVLGSNVEYYQTTFKESEMIKCAQNTMLASRVAIANMIYDACLDNKVDYQKVKRLAFDNFEILGPHMTQVPGPDGKRGFGGKCLPKDIRALSTVSDSRLLKEIINYNNSLRDDLDKFLMNYKI